MRFIASLISFTVQHFSSPVLWAIVIVARGSAMVPYCTIIFLRLALRQLRDHVQHPLPLRQHHSPRTRSPQFAQRHCTRRSTYTDCREVLECRYSVNGSVIASVYVRQYRKLTRVSGSVSPTREAHRGTPLPVSSVHSLSPNLPVWPLTPSQRGSH